MQRYALLLAIMIVTISSFSIYFFRYNVPNSPYWDENYHIASAEKYLTGTFFFEPHPPLGKMLIALGEKVTHSNSDIDKSSFNNTDFIKNFPTNYSFFGVRLLPTIFAVIASILFFILIFTLTKSIIISLATWLFYLLDTAIILHFRGAMLDGIQITFSLAALIFFATLVQDKTKSYFWKMTFLGLFVGLAVATKLNGLYLLSLYLFLIPWKQIRHILSRDFCREIIAIFYSILVGCLVVLSIYITHLAITENIVDDRTYELDQTPIDIVKNGYKNPTDYLTMTVKYIEYENKYNTKVPALNLTSPTENGSPPLTWAFGIKPIRYRYDTNFVDTSYLYLTPNPVVWGIGLIGLILSISLIISKFLFKLEVVDKKLYKLITVFCFLYLSYMVPMFFISRVMYLYHYIPALVISIILFGLNLAYLRSIYRRRETIFTIVIALLIAMTVYVFCLYSPLVYYKKISCPELKGLEISKLWQMSCPTK